VRDRRDIGQDPERLVMIATGIEIEEDAGIPGDK
jgi:hypothetical protein